MKNVQKTLKNNRNKIILSLYNDQMYHVNKYLSVRNVQNVSELNKNV